MKLGKRKLVVNRCKWDPATDYGAYWSDELILQKARDLDIPYEDLYAALARKANWDHAIESNDAILVCGTGHGNEQVYTGQDGEALLTRGREEDGELMRGRFGAFLSCVFGQAADWFMAKGMRGFYGYTVTFYFLASNYPNSAAEGFFRADAAVIISYLKGGTNKDRREASDAAWDAFIASADAYTARYAIWDRDGRIFRGLDDDGPYLPEPPTFKCCVCGVECEVCGDLITHICREHCPEPPQPERPWWCKIFGRLVGCPLP